MKRFAAVALLALVTVSTACTGKNGGGGPAIQRPMDDSGQRDHVDPTTPVFGQQR